MNDQAKCAESQTEQQGARKPCRGAVVRMVALVACLLMALALVGCSGSGSSSESASDSSSSSQQSSEPEKTSVDETKTSQTAGGNIQGSEAGSNGYIEEATDKYSSGTWYATVQVTGYDPFTITLDAKDAPVSVSNFCNLAENSYYNGLAFYRVVENFCLQGGTKGNTASGSDSSLIPIIGEFSENGVENALADKFDYGTVAMARTTENNSATSTFFITLGNHEYVGTSLDGQYAAFGTIDAAGMEIVSQIVDASIGAADSTSMGVIEDEADMPIIESITISDTK